jgi:transcriptional regulator with XRE-family HTH domain
MAIWNERIHKRRKESGITLAQIAEKLGVTEATAQRYERGNIKSIPYEHMCAYGEILHCSPCYLMGWEEELVSRESSKILQYYETLNDIGKHEATKRVEELTYIPQYTKKNEEDYLRVNAAHARTDIEPTDEDQAHDDAIMNDDSEWE